MSDILGLDDHRPHETRKMKCWMCDYDWQAVFPENTPEINCPSCYCKMPVQTYGTEIIGPFPGGIFYIASHGFKIPFVVAMRQEKERDLWTVQVDGRFEADVKAIEICKWSSILANAMAVSAGYSCHGENSQPLNRFKTRISEMS